MEESEGLISMNANPQNPIHLEPDPLACAKYQGKMPIMAFI